MRNGVYYIAAEGFLDAHTFEEMNNLINKLFAQRCYKLVIHLEKLDYISSAGAGVFVGAIGDAMDNGGNIVFLKPSSPVQEVFDLLGLSQIFSFAQTIEEAMQTLM